MRTKFCPVRVDGHVRLSDRRRTMIAELRVETAMGASDTSRAKRALLPRENQPGRGPLEAINSSLHDSQALLNGWRRHTICGSWMNASPTCPRTEREASEFPAALPAEQFLLAAQTLAHRQKVQLIAQHRAQGYELVAMPEQLPEIAFRRCRYPDARKALGQQIQNEPASRSSVFCLRTSVARILAESPIHNWWPSSESKRSNQCIGPVASMPTRTVPCKPR